VALIAGAPGMCTLHANPAREALTELCTLPLLAGENICCCVHSDQYEIARPSRVDNLQTTSSGTSPSSRSSCLARAVGFDREDLSTSTRLLMQ
jgi:hypothetical protein